MSQHLNRSIRKNYTRKNYLLMALVPALIGLSSCGTAASSSESPAAIAQTAEATTEASTLNTTAYAAALSAYVDEQGLVNYEALQADRQGLDAYNASLALTPQETFDSWSEAEQLAVLINAYNSLTLKAIIDESPIKDSIKDIRGVWRFNKHSFLQDKLTLNNIEHDIMRVDYNEPRLHAAIVCAAISCPYLRQEPFTGEDLDAQLDDQVRIFLSREEVLNIDRENNVVSLSKIFDWFGQDWVPTYGVEEGFAGSKNEQAVLNFISGYLEEDDRTYLEAGGYDIRYSDYDWALNRQ
ncbi:MAG: DUF547 domain-containing protein [Cyanobacteria bacterium P01_D01_bin.105]